MRLRGMVAVASALLVAMGCDGLSELPPLPEPDPTIRVQDWNYIQGKYFFLVNPNGTVPPPQEIRDVRLYLDNRTIPDDITLGAIPTRVWIDPDAQVREPGIPAVGQFHQLREIEDYTLANETNFSFPRIELLAPLGYEHTLAVAYIQTDAAGVTDTVGTWWPEGFTPGPTDSLDLKMLRPSDEQWRTDDLRGSVWASVRHLEAKDVYWLRATDIEEGSLRVNVVRDIAGPTGHNPDYIVNEFGKRTPLLQVLGLDQKNNMDGTRIPDTRIDPEFLDYENGLLRFPDLRPFDPNLADIEGIAGVRERSWPRNPEADRPDTLGWSKSGGLAVPSNAQQRDLEVIPEIYDLKYSRLSAMSSQLHIYTIEITIRAD